MKNIFFLIGFLLFGMSYGFGQILSPRQYDEQLVLLSEQLAKKLTQYPALREYVKEKCGERFDGDYNFLLAPHLSDLVLEEKSLQSIILEGLERPDALLSFLQYQKQLQLAIPNLWEAWNTEQGITVAYIPADYEEHLATAVNGFSPAGDPVQLSVLKAPAFPVAILGQNERTNAAGDLLPLYGPIINANGPAGGPFGGNINTGGSSTCYGGDGEWEYISSIKASNLNALEHWMAGVPEVRFVVKRNDDHSLLNGEMGAILIPNSRDDINNQWDVFNATLFRWYNEVQGSPLVGNNCVFFVSEKDNGDWFSTPVTLGVTTPNGMQVEVSFTIQLTDKDEWIGTVPVYFEDCNFFEYNPGSLQFKLKRN